MKKVNYW